MLNLSFLYRAVLLMALTGSAPGPSLTAAPLNSQFHSLRDVRAGPDFIRRAATAVVQVGRGTGSFIRFGGRDYLMTNHHVVGGKNCSIDGCFVKLLLDFEKGKSFKEMELFLRPVAGSVDLDVTFYTMSTGPKKKPFQPPSTLVLENRSARSLLENLQKVHIIGHPRLAIKKWNAGEVVRLSRHWVKLNYFSLPGGSGSPLLDRSGKVVGIHHKGSKQNDMITRNGFLYTGVATAGADLIRVLQTGLQQPRQIEPLFRSATQPVTMSSFLKNPEVFYSARQIPRMKNRRPFFKELVKACATFTDWTTPAVDKFVRSSKACQVMKEWYQCRKPGIIYRCPVGQEKKEVLALYKRLATRTEAFAGKSPVGWYRAAGQLESDELLAGQMTLQKISEFYVRDQLPLNFAMAKQLATYAPKAGQVVLGSTDIAAFVLGYRKYRHFQYELPDAIRAAYQLCKRRIITRQDLSSLYERILAEAQLTLNGRLLAETMAYRSGLIRLASF